MEKKSKYLNSYVCGIELDDLKRCFQEYRLKTEAGEITLPSLPHFLSTLPDYVGEDDLQSYLQENGGKGGAYKESVKTVKWLLQWFRGQYLSNPAWCGAQAQKAILALGKNYGDGVSYAKTEKDTGPNTLNVRFGDTDMSSKAGK